MRIPYKVMRDGAEQQKLAALTPSAGEPFPIAAPTEGMNTRDSVATLRPTECRSMKNMIAERGKCVIRKGKTSHQTISGASSIGAMFTHEGASANVVLAAADGEIYNVTGSPAALTTASYNSDAWVIAQFNDTSIGVNGQDTPWAFDGTSIAATGLSGSGLTLAYLRTVHVAGVRMWFTEVNKADVWYLAVNAVTGALTKFQLSQETKGGYCVGVYEFRNYTIFVMSTGEIVVYQGDPGDDFSLAARYHAPLPVGYNPGFYVAGEPIIMTTSGPIPFEGIAAGQFDTVSLNTWGKIAPSWAEDFENYGSNSGWNATYYRGLVIINVQVDSTTSKQWVYNTRTKSWSYFDNLDAYQFTEDSGTLYFGDKGSDEIFTYSGGTDDESPITGIIRGGFIYPYESRATGEYTLAKLNIESTGFATAQVQVDVDFQEAGISAPEYAISSTGSGPWGGAWDGPWGTSGQPILKWSSISGFGRAAAIVVKLNSQADDLAFYGADLIVARAGAL